jgi:hypothetical protein
MSNRSQISGGKKAKRVQISRSDLLPMPAAIFQTISIRAHLGLVALREGAGNHDIACELLKTIYLTSMIADAEKNEAWLEICVAAELTIKESIAHAYMAQTWELKPGRTLYIEKMLCLHDALFLTLPRHKVAQSAKHLASKIDEGSLPDLACAYRKNLEKRSRQFPVAVNSELREPLSLA